MQTTRKTIVSISERTYTGNDVHPAMQRKERIIIHDNYQWHIGCVHDDAELKQLLEFLEIELTTVDHEVEWETTGKIVFYNLSKNINPHAGLFWTLEQLREQAKKEKLKKVKGLSNGSIVDCYIGIGEDIVNIYRPNPNAKEVYIPFSTLKEELQYRENHWYL